MEKSATMRTMSRATAEHHLVNRVGLAIVRREILPGPDGQAGGRLQCAVRGGAARGGRGERRRYARRIGGRFQENDELGHGLGAEQGRGVAEVHGDRDVVEGRDDRRCRSGYRIALRVHAAALAQGEQRDPSPGARPSFRATPRPTRILPFSPGSRSFPRRYRAHRGLALACAVGRAVTLTVLVLPFAELARQRRTGSAPRPSLRAGSAAPSRSPRGGEA